MAFASGGPEGEAVTVIVMDKALTGPELLDWLALRRVRRGGVAMLGSHYLDQGRKVPCFLPTALHRLADTGLTELLDPDHPGGVRRIVISPDGRVRYQELSALRSTAVDPDRLPGSGEIFPEPLLPDRGRLGPQLQK
ncbi:MAG: hypothetical protein ACRDTC_21610 [Pseudonocardiaceae bacterium]